jgi:hypothetical protein
LRLLRPAADQQQPCIFELARTWAVHRSGGRAPRKRRTIR